MSYMVHFEDGKSEDTLALATTKGLADLTRWVETLPADHFGHLQAFLAQGQVEDTAKLSVQLNAALAAVTSIPPKVKSTARQLADAIGVGSKTEIASITAEG